MRNRPTILIRIGCASARSRRASRTTSRSGSGGQAASPLMTAIEGCPGIFPKGFCKAILQSGELSPPVRRRVAGFPDTRAMTKIRVMLDGGDYCDVVADVLTFDDDAAVRGAKGAG